MEFAVAVNAEAHDLQDGRRRRDPARRALGAQRSRGRPRYAVKAINRALQGITVPTVVHLCFGYAAVVPGSTKPAGYSFLAELADTAAEQISIEAAQPRLDLGVLKDLSAKTIMLGVLDLGDPEIESVDTVADRIRNGLKYVSRRQARAGAGLRHEIHAARHRLRQAEGDGGCGREGEERDQLTSST